VIGYIELLRASQIIINRTEQPLQVLLGAGAFYFVMSFVLSRLAGIVERRWQF
jgi:polar amino acid transport system permease protein